ncbi:MAG TPA: glycine betaine ABC transporter substrate-binding protein [Solirubrobacterales bacterium]|nr:glycine betaine ABC transporter substrate-binding protein [Solirubrobacterales bacterium]
MRRGHPLLALLAAFFVLASTLALAACGDDDSSSGDGGSGDATAIERNADNADTTITVGSKNFTEQFILGEIYAQALEAAGYRVRKDLNLGSEQIALRALKGGDVDGYPEYTSTALTSFFDVQPQDIPKDPEQAVTDAQSDFEREGLVAYAPTPFTSANAVGVLKSKAEELGVTKVSDLEGKSEDLTLYGSPECRQRVDCLVGLQENYGLRFKKFTPVDIGLRYDVLDKGQADLSIIFTTDAQLSTRDDVITLEDDKQVFPPGNVTFVASKETADAAGPDLKTTVESVQEGLTERVMQELNARVDVDREEPSAVARAYLREAGYIQ